jgi:transmembrane protein 231
VIVSNPNIIPPFIYGKRLKFYLFIDGTEFRNGHYTPIYGPPDGLLRIHSYIRYTEAVLEYTPGIWNVLKWAWIQYASILFIFYNVVGIFKNVVFGQQMIPTWNEKRIKTVSR